MNGKLFALRSTVMRLKLVYCNCSIEAVKGELVKNFMALHFNLKAQRFKNLYFCAVFLKVMFL